MSSTTLWMPASVAQDAAPTKVEHLSIDEMLPLVGETAEVREVRQEGDQILFKFRDKDDDLIVLIAQELDDHRLVVLTGMTMPEDNLVASLAAANQWNGESFAHGTFSYTGQNAESQQLAVLESHLLLTGGVMEANIRAWLANFVQHINHWEEVLLEKWRQVPTDTEIASSGKGSGEGFWNTLSEGLALANTLSG